MTAIPPTEIIAGQLYAVGGLLPLDGRESWAPASARALQPTQAYVLLGGESALVIDPGLLYVRDGVLSGLHALIPEAMPVEVFLSRAQFDTIGNLGALSGEFHVTRVYTGGVLNPFDAFGVAPLTDQRSKGATVLRSPEHSRLEVVHPALRLLTTFWGYDGATKTLFTSDSFTYGVLDAPGERPVIDDPDVDRTSLSDIRDHVLATFPWLSGAATYPIVESLRSIFDMHDVETIAPDRGCVLHGRRIVERHVDMLCDVLTAEQGVAA